MIIIKSYNGTLWLFNIAMENHHFLGKPSINGPFSMAMLNNQRVIVIIENKTKLVVIQQCKDHPIEIIEDLSSKNRCGQPEYDRI